MMKPYFKQILILSGLLLAQFSLASNKLSQKLADCAAVEDDYGRLVCYDNLSKSQNVATSDAQNTNTELSAENQNKLPNPQLPALVADIDEAGFMYSLGRMDLLGAEFDAMLVGIGHRVNVADFSFSQQPDIYFNAFAQIRAQFDVEELSTRNNRGGALINTDFSVGGELVQHRPEWSWRLSYRHQSSHLGDEFLIENRDYLEQRINFSYETLGFLAFKSFDKLDIYGGGSFITRMEPNGLNHFQWQAGWQYHATENQDFNPVIGMQFNGWSEADRHLNMTLRAGIEVNRWLNRPVNVFFEYQEGHASYGQFFTEDFRYFGLTVFSDW